MISKKILIDETMYFETLNNGLKVYMHPKNDFIDFHVSLQVGIGGETIDYVFDGKKYEIPSGSAHFLEHVIFENNGFNLSDEFSKYNADVNASTSRDITKYYFSVQENFEIVFKIFLEHFSSFNIGQKTIDKEREIILKEIMMYEDNLFYQVHDDLMKHMYKDKKIWEDIAGTVKSVKAINHQVIHQCIDHFYRPNNMSLVITGPFDPDKIVHIIKNSRINALEPTVMNPVVNLDLSGTKKHHIFKINPKQTIQYVALGVKIDLSLFDHLAVSQKRLAIIMFFDYFFNESSKNYQTLKKEKLVNYSYYQSTQINDQYGYFFISSESRYPVKLKNRLIDMLNHLGQIDEDLFIAAKRSRIGHFIGYFDNAKSIIKAISDFTKKGIDFLTYIDNVSHISLEDMYINKLTITKDNIYSVIYAKK